MSECYSQASERCGCCRRLIDDREKIVWLSRDPERWDPVNMVPLHAKCAAAQRPLDPKPKKPAPAYPLPSPRFFFVMLQFMLLSYLFLDLVGVEAHPLRLMLVWAGLGNALMVLWLSWGKEDCDG